MDLFAAAPTAKQQPSSQPLAERMRPADLEQFVGQEHLLAPGKLLNGMLTSGKLRSLIFWGPPGSGKTTLAQIIAKSVSAAFVNFSAVTSGVKDLKKIIHEAEQLQRLGKATILFIDEIHHFNKAQQDNFLPHVERGTLIIIGATTENPSFELISPLLSRCQVLVLKMLSPADLGTVVDRALDDGERGLGKLKLKISAEGREFLIQQAQGDCRTALNALENAATLTEAHGGKEIGLRQLQEALQSRVLRYDKSGEEHYNVISAFIKSMRGSDADAALYWMMRMIEAGEDPLFIARRMVIFAAEDIGNADPQALQVALAAKDAVHFVGLPEGRIPLAQAAIYLASAPKSNASYKAMLAAAQDVKERGALPVPHHLRNAPTALMQQLGYGKDYKYAHDYEDQIIDQQHLPAELLGKRYYAPSDSGYERQIQARLKARQDKRNERKR